MSTNLIILDGPAYVGKNQIALELARLTGFEWVNSASWFQALAHRVLLKGCKSSDIDAILKIPFEVHFEKGRMRVNGEDWTPPVDQEALILLAAQLESEPKIRDSFREQQQRNMGQKTRIMTGMAIGSTLFPDAVCRIYITASDKVRAERFYKKLPESARTAEPLTAQTITKIIHEHLRPSPQENSTLSELQAREQGYFIYDNSESPSAHVDARHLYQNPLKLRLSLSAPPVTESIARLREICQTTAKKDKSNVYMRYVCRFFSIYLTRLLLPTKATPNHISLSMTLMGLFANLFFLCPNPLSYLIGAGLFQLWYILDCMDGEMARYRYYQKTGFVMIDKRQSTIGGIYFDIINHYIMNCLIPLTVAFGVYTKTHSALPLLVGMGASLGQVLLLAMHDGRYRALYSHIRKYKYLELLESSPVVKAPLRERGFIHWAFMIQHYLMTYPTVMNLVTLSALFNFFNPALESRIALLIFLCFGSLVVATVLIVRTISRGLVDEEFKTTFNAFDNILEQTTLQKESR